ncbi:hypothetical protein ACHZ97_00625 [Lysobacter soli]|uniref:hypothetical protein n=1 Tax=Lysobacter soli TaxID=453783 RepID=UPI0037CBD010
MSPYPDSSHDWAVWLNANLLDIEVLAPGALRGRLAAGFDLDEVLDKIEACCPSLIGVVDRAKRLIEVHPAIGDVYDSLDALLQVPANQRRVPAQFTLQDVGYSFPAEPLPADVAKYVTAVDLWQIMLTLADHVSDAPKLLHFIQSHDSKLALAPSFSIHDARGLEGVAEFDRDFVRTDLHKEQKRNIIRASLIDVFKGRSKITLGELMREFGPFLGAVKSSYAIYAADFSYEKVRDEVEEQNLDDMLRLNKTLSDIQNQLLALPAALLFAGASVGAGALVKNASIMLGVLIFAWFMFKLIGNQIHSVRAIEGEVSLRKQRLAAQPEAVSSKFDAAFAKIDKRVARQLSVLRRIRIVIVAVVLLVAVIVVVAQYYPQVFGTGESPARSDEHTLILLEQKAERTAR